MSCATAPLDAAYAGTVSPPWKERREAKLIMLPRRPVVDEVDGAGWESMWDPMERQRVNTVVRFTWITCLEEVSVSMTHEVK